MQLHTAALPLPPPPANKVHIAIPLSHFCLFFPAPIQEVSERGSFPWPPPPPPITSIDLLPFTLAWHAFNFIFRNSFSDILIRESNRPLIWQQGALTRVEKMLPSFRLASWGGKPVPKKSAGGKEKRKCFFYSIKSSLLPD